MDRREFLKTLGAMLAGLAIWKWVRPLEQLYPPKARGKEAKHWEGEDLAG